ncbi:MobA/MobL family protein [Nitrospirillum amazonense]|uniref:MobA/MobL family protein n=1 Tax=Nitrospirillum amazonense TaxID=28077 RepID=A0A560EIX9_9PROT|nr:MobQ family relaxase [Nitrospirillum amazonense]TWB09324.1 MobA/MobL family protein [Nitrospirillum amazonense]
MATYRLEAKIIGRSHGRSATAAAAYRAAVRIDDERTGQSFDYTRKQGVLHSEIMAPAGTPAWMYDRVQLWNAVEKVEKRKDSQLARDILMSLPHELTHEQRVDLVREFVATEFVAQGMIADVAIHAPDRQGDDRNHHCHILLTMRELTGEGFGKKVRAWNDTEQLEQWRADWAEVVNRHLERHGHHARVDHRSLADQGIDREPEPKQGPVATEMERQGRESHAGNDRRAVQARNAERAELDAELMVLSAEIIDLEQQRADRARQEPMPVPAQGAAGEEKWEARGPRTALGPTQGGMVAQQMDALDRFRENSEALEKQRRERLQRINEAIEKQGQRDQQVVADRGRDPSEDRSR